MPGLRLGSRDRAECSGALGRKLNRAGSGEGFIPCTGFRLGSCNFAECWGTRFAFCDRAGRNSRFMPALNRFGTLPSLGLSSRNYAERSRALGGNFNCACGRQGDIPCPRLRLDGCNSALCACACIAFYDRASERKGFLPSTCLRECRRHCAECFGARISAFNLVGNSPGFRTQRHRFGNVPGLGLGHCNCRKRFGVGVQRLNRLGSVQGCIAGTRLGLCRSYCTERFGTGRHWFNCVGDGCGFRTQRHRLGNVPSLGLGHCNCRKRFGPRITIFNCMRCIEGGSPIACPGLNSCDCILCFGTSPQILNGSGNRNSAGKHQIAIIRADKLQCVAYLTERFGFLLWVREQFCQANCFLGAAYARKRSE